MLLSNSKCTMQISWSSMNSEKYVHALLLNQGKHVRFSKTCLYLSFQSMYIIHVSLSTGMQNTLVRMTYFVFTEFH